MIDVSWYNTDKKAEYNVDIEVYANDRNGLLADLVQEVNKTNSKITGVNARATKDNIVVTEMSVELKNVEDLNKIMKDLRKVNSVYEVRRRK